MAEAALAKAESKLIHLTLEIPEVSAMFGNKPEPCTWLMEHRRKYIDIQLQWLAQFVASFPHKQQIQDRIFFDFGSGSKSANTQM